MQWFGKHWPPNTTLVTSGMVGQRNGKWYRSGPAVMEMKSYTIEKPKPIVGDYLAHVLYDEKCTNSALFATRAEAAKAPLVEPTSGLVNVNFAYKNGRWVYHSGI
jgi:hypothetical protein